MSIKITMGSIFRTLWNHSEVYPEEYMYENNYIQWVKRDERAEVESATQGKLRGVKIR
jgi:hypothetical protein